MYLNIYIVNIAKCIYIQVNRGIFFTFKFIFGILRLAVHVSETCINIPAEMD